MPNFALINLAFALFALPQAQIQKIDQPHQISLTEIRRSLALIEKDIQAGEKWKIESGQYVDLNYADGSLKGEMTVQGCIDVLDRAAANDCVVLKLPLPSERIPVYLYPDADSLSRALGMNMNADSGVSLGNWAVIIARPNMSYSDLEKKASHEIGHAIAHRYIGQFCPPLIAEGIADYLAGRFVKADWIKNPTPVEPTAIKSLLGSAKTATDFSQGAAFCAFLMKRSNDDPTPMKTLLSNLNQARMDEIRGLGKGTWQERMDRAFVEAYGAPPDTLDSLWRQKYSNQAVAIH